MVSKNARRPDLFVEVGARWLFGYKAEEAIGKPITIIIRPELHEAVVVHLNLPQVKRAATAKQTQQSRDVQVNRDNVIQQTRHD